jgi:hypothetical protein
MARHRGPTLSFDYPRDWEDRTEVRYVAQTRRGLEGDVVPGRAALVTERLASDESLSGYVERRLAAMASEPGFVIREVREVRVEERPGLRVRYATVSDGAPLEHHALFVGAKERHVATLTLSSPRSELAQNEPLFERMLASVRIGERD